MKTLLHRHFGSVALCGALACNGQTDHGNPGSPQQVPGRWSFREAHHAALPLALAWHGDAALAQFGCDGVSIDGRTPLDDPAANWFLVYISSSAPEKQYSVVVGAGGSKGEETNSIDTSLGTEAAVIQSWNLVSDSTEWFPQITQALGITDAGPDDAGRTFAMTTKAVVGSCGIDTILPCPEVQGALVLRVFDTWHNPEVELYPTFRIALPP